VGRLFAVIVVVIAAASATIFMLHVWWPPPDISVHGAGIDRELGQTMVATGIRTAPAIVPPASVKALVNAASASMPGPKSETRV